MHATCSPVTFMINGFQHGGQLHFGHSNHPVAVNIFLLLFIYSFRGLPILTKMAIVVLFLCFMLYTRTLLYQNKIKKNPVQTKPLVQSHVFHFFFNFFNFDLYSKFTQILTTRTSKTEEECSRTKKKKED